MKNLKTVFAAFREMHRLEKRVIPTAVTVAVVTAIMPFVNIWFTSKIIDLLGNAADIKTLAVYIGLAVGINAVLFFVNYYLGDMQFVYRSLMYNKELQRISSKLLDIEYQKLENSKFKELVHKHSEAQDRVFSSFVQLVWMMRDFISGALTLIISVVIITPLLKIGFMKTGNSFFERPAFILTIFGAIAVMAVIILVVAVKMNKAWFKASDEYSRLDRIFYYFLNMFSDYNTGKEIRIYKEQDLIKHTATDKLLTDGEKILKKASANTARQSSFVAILGALVGFGIYLFIGVKGLYGLFGIGSLVLYCGAFMQIIGGIMKMTVTFGKTAEMVPLVNYYFEIVNTENEMTYGNKTLDLSNGFNIEFKNVSFKYPGTKNYALQNVNLSIKNGEHLAVVGRNGSGKTTFIKLMCRLYDVTDGEILINGVNIKEYTKESIINLYSVVFQDFKIFSVSLKDNICAGSTLDNNKLYSCLESANIADRTRKMPKKENTYLYKDLDKSGVEISGGEAQKLALARALYKDAPVVVLDEPTAALDPIAENEIYSRFNSFVENKTAIYISHRLSSCVFCDKVAVFDKSRLVENGTHKELLSADGKYFELWNAQAKYYV
ncbi:ABC transporter ATP-binding protein [uncultured Eubacterium sp.]|uniref:ABC transporter ATP-binding protein n=1 Tax=uncultured Eubacterium sp. TaxID=165185 RepID=UPI002804F7C8|nr:ABC transporter ATP-binding protein [uncultured Eubacterium sp.]